MAQNYECAILMDPGLSDEQVQAYLTSFSKLITDRGGEVVHTQVWGKRRLEYPVEARNEAIYAFLYFRMITAGDLVVEMERQVRIQENLLREMTVRVPELKIKEAPNQESRFTESARLAYSGRSRGGPRGPRGPRSDYGDRRYDSQDGDGGDSAPAGDSAANVEAPGSETPSAE
jgi:small subunit ribosomal protein S6